MPVGLNPQTVPPAQEWDREKQGPTGVLQLEELSRKSQGASPNCNPSDGGCELSPCEQMLKRDVEDGSSTKPVPGSKKAGATALEGLGAP